jgi:predicted unusual protein kinase regulating ubiquinone biosynthesis (AarF/ABC1/UbiB family)
MTQLASLGMRSTAAAVMGASDDGAGLARATVETLGAMRGLALKVGQMASYVDGCIPVDYQDAFERTLRTLRDGAPAMSEREAARVVRTELGDEPSRLFAEWSAAPFAAASIGQVHRARLFDGRLVAVKVQYEGIEKAVLADLANASMFSGLLGPLQSKFGLRGQIEEMRARFGEELDYSHEAERQTRFGEIFAGDPRVRVPAVVAELSTSRVLTTELASGVDFEEACRRPEIERAAWAETLWRFVFGSLLGHGLFNADPHPGNYVFAPDGVVWFLDFGCTRKLLPERVAFCIAAHRSALAGDEEGLFAAIESLMGIPPGDQRRRARSFTRACFAPILAYGPFRITREYATDLFDAMVHHAIDMARGPRAELTPMPVDVLFLNRLQFGFYSVLARLDVAVDYGALEEKLPVMASSALRAS